MSVAKGGLPGLPEIDWGARACHFYRSRAELIDTALPFAIAGIDANEMCLWLTAEPATSAEALAALSARLPDFERRQQSGQFEVADRDRWYATSAGADAVAQWLQRKDDTLARGFSALRLIDNPVRHLPTDPGIDDRLREQRIVGLFSYSLAEASAEDVLEIASRHELTWTKHGSAAKTAATNGSAAQPEFGWLQSSWGTRWRFDQQLQEADARKNEFLGMLGHDLRNPLASILTASQLMVLRGGEQQFQKELDIVQRQVGHLTAMLNDVLDMSRISGGRLEIERTELEMAEAIQRAVQIAAPLVEKRSHRLEVTCPPQGLAVNGDPARLAQIFANLLTNAARYTEPGGQIALRAARSDGSVAVTVKDNGRGIAPGKLATIFKSYGHDRKSRSRGGEGLGLGLSIAHGLVSLHGGTIEATSVVDSGSEFVVRLPAV